MTRAHKHLGLALTLAMSGCLATDEEMLQPDAAFEPEAEIGETSSELINGNLLNQNLLNQNLLNQNLFNGNLLAQNLFAGNLINGNLFNGNLLAGNLMNGNLFAQNLLNGNLMNGNLYYGNLFAGNLFAGNLINGNLFAQNLLNGNLLNQNLLNGNLLSGNLFAANALSTSDNATILFAGNGIADFISPPDRAFLRVGGPKTDPGMRHIHDWGTNTNCAPGAAVGTVQVGAISNTWTSAALSQFALPGLSSLAFVQNPSNANEKYAVAGAMNLYNPCNKPIRGEIEAHAYTFAEIVNARIAQGGYGGYSNPYGTWQNQQGPATRTCVRSTKKYNLSGGPDFNAATDNADTRAVFLCAAAGSNREGIWIKAPLSGSFDPTQVVEQWAQKTWRMYFRGNANVPSDPNNSYVDFYAYKVGYESAPAATRNTTHYYSIRHYGDDAWNLLRFPWTAGFRFKLIMAFYAAWTNSQAATVDMVAWVKGMSNGMHAWDMRPSGGAFIIPDTNFMVANRKPVDQGLVSAAPMISVSRGQGDPAKNFLSAAYIYLGAGNNRLCSTAVMSAYAMTELQTFGPTLSMEEALIALGIKPFPANVTDRNNLRKKLVGVLAVDGVDGTYTQLRDRGYMLSPQFNSHVTRVNNNVAAAGANPVRPPSLAMCDGAVHYLPALQTGLFRLASGSLATFTAPIGSTRAARDRTVGGYDVGLYMDNYGSNYADGARKVLTRASTSIRTDWSLGATPNQYDYFAGPNGETNIYPPQVVGTGGTSFYIAEPTVNYPVQAQVGTYVDTITEVNFFSCTAAEVSSPTDTCPGRFGSQWSCLLIDKLGTGQSSYTCTTITAPPAVPV